MITTILMGVFLQAFRPKGEREPGSPGSLQEESDKSLEARPEADFPTQGGIGTATPRTPRVGPPAAR